MVFLGIFARIQGSFVLKRYKVFRLILPTLKWCWRRKLPVVSGFLDRDKENTEARVYFYSRVLYTLEILALLVIFLTK